MESVFSVSVSGSNVYAATYCGLVISTNGGSSFTSKTTTDGLGNNLVIDILVDGTTLYVATSYNGLSISTNGGNSFATKTSADGLGDDDVRDIFVDSSRLYVATSGGLSISTNGGNSFVTKTTANGLGSNVARSIYANGNMVFVGTDNGLSISTDSGDSFTNRTTADGLGSNKIYSIYADGNKLYAKTRNGLSISTDNGNSFVAFTIGNGLGSNSVNDIQVVNGKIYTATDGGLSISNKSPQVINITTHAPTSAVYRSSFTVAASGGASGNPVTYSAAGSCTNSGATFTMTKGTGPCEVKFSQAGNDDYLPAQVKESVTAQKAALTVTAVTDAKEYDGSQASVAIPVITAGSLLGADTATWSQTFDTKDADAGKTITPAGIVNDSNGGNNYNVTFLPVTTGTISSRPITVAADAKSKTVDSPDPALTYQLTSGSLIAPDAFSGALNRVTGESAGDYSILQGTLTAGNNYSMSFVGANLTITAAPIQTLTITSSGSYDGWVLESAQASSKGGSLNATGKTFQLGDDILNRQYKAILSFNVTLPTGAVIQSATLRIKQSGKSVGKSPFNWPSSLLVDVKKGAFGNVKLEVGDFQALASAKKAGAFGKTATNGWYSVTLNAAGISKISTTGVTQLRLSFSKGDNNNFKTDILKFFSGNNPTNKPELIITYTAP